MSSIRLPDAALARIEGLRRSLAAAEAELAEGDKHRPAMAGELHDLGVQASVLEHEQLVSDWEPKLKAVTATAQTKTAELRNLDQRLDQLRAQIRNDGQVLKRLEKYQPASEVELVKVDLPKGNLAKQLQTCRARITTLGEQLRELNSAPLPADELRQQLPALVQARGDSIDAPFKFMGDIKIGDKINRRRIELTGYANITAALCRLFPERVIADGEAWLDQHGDTGSAIAQVELDAKLRTVRAELDEQMYLQEALVTALREAGEHALRDPDTPAHYVLLLRTTTATKLKAGA